MSFLELVKMRHSVRNYENRAVEKEKLDYIMEGMCTSGSFSSKFSALEICGDNGCGQAVTAEKGLSKRVDRKCTLYDSSLCES